VQLVRSRGQRLHPLLLYQRGLVPVDGVPNSVVLAMLVVVAVVNTVVVV
jgi:hypothetical protein